MKKLALLLLVGGSCSMPWVKPPKGFVPIDRGIHAFAATAADGSKLFVSVHYSQPEADEDFWKEVVIRDLRTRGYEPVPAEGAMEFSTSAGSVAYRYLVAVVVQGTTVHTIEFGCEEANFARHREAVYTFIKEYRG